MLFLDGEGKEGGKEGQGRRERRGSVRSFVGGSIYKQKEEEAEAAFEVEVG